MRWEGRQGSRNVEDRRGQTMKRVGGGIGIGAILIAIVAMLLGDQDALGSLMNDAIQGGPATQTTTQEYRPSAQEQELAQMVSVVLKETEDVWADIFTQQLGRRYQPAVLVLFSGSSDSACGSARAAT